MCRGWVFRRGSSCLGLAFWGVGFWDEMGGGQMYGRSGFEVEDSRAVIAAGRAAAGACVVSVSVSMIA